MANLVVTAKEMAQKLPYPIAKFVKYVPFNLRMGSAYTQSRDLIAEFRYKTIVERKAWLLTQMRRVLADAYRDIPFYKSFYNQQGFDPDSVCTWDDLQRIPILTKEILRSVAPELKARPGGGRMLLNTGGTSGQPFEFFVDGNAFAREWAHMHAIWERLGYKRTDLKLTLRGKNHGKQAIRYNPVHNELSVNAYGDRAQLALELNDWISRQPILYVHGYPSAIYEAMVYLRDHAPAVLEKLKTNLQGVFYGSEYPAPQYRDTVRQCLGCADISWYGHSEMAVLAGENGEAHTYEPFHTYGYVEALVDSHGTARLLGSSLMNSAAPLIRYDTGDIIKPTVDQGLLTSFQVSEGRIGDFVTDKSGKRIPLTALVFGRHHKLFSWASFVQVAQTEQGKVTVVISADPAQNKTPTNAAQDFDTSNVAIDFEFVMRDSPVKTPAGKTPLLIKPPA